MRVFSAVAILPLIFLVVSRGTVQAVTIPTVPVGNAGNAGDVQFDGTFGAVAYNYRIGTTEVTNAQYAEFLNAKALSDPLALYATEMGSDVRGGIVRSGTDGAFNYTIKPNMGNKPVNFVTWYDTLRFANWLNNGQGDGDTESGAYTLLGGTPQPFIGDDDISRNPGSTWFLPSDNEWYKAAYYDASLNGGAGGYWNFPTRSNSAPMTATANSVGDISNPGPNVANHSGSAVWNGEIGNVTTVGSAGPMSESFYGTSDQGGNVWEWNEGRLFGGYRSLRGSSWNEDAFQMQSAFQNSDALPSDYFVTAGFRVATVPEPSSAVLSILACALMICRRLRRS